MKKAKLLFDLDGTISDPIEGIGLSLNYALQAHGYPQLPVTEVSKYIGPQLDEIFATIVGASDQNLIKVLVSSYRESYRDVGYLKNQIYDGIRELIADLTSQQILLAICTSKISEFAEGILRHFKIREYFEFISSGEVGIRKSQQISALLFAGQIDTDTIMIGDRAVDMAAAHSNGLRAAAVSWGHGSLEELTAENPEFIFSKPQELLCLQNVLKV